MPNHPFVWYELSTTDVAAGVRFYETVVGWASKDAGMPDMTYMLLSAGPDQIAGVMALPEEARAMGVPPHWLGYVGVDEVDGAVDRAKGLGAQVYFGPTDIPDVGRFAVLADAQGAAFAVFKGTAGQGAERDPRKVGQVCWHELYTSDLDAGFGFYSALFGWTKGDTHDMGQMGVYQLFKNGEAAIGGMMRRPPQMTVSAWNYYFNVGQIDAAVERVRSAGGAVLMGPMEVPGGAWVAQAQDPQGAHFAILGARG